MLEHSADLYDQENREQAHCSLDQDETGLMLSMGIMIALIVVATFRFLKWGHG